MAWLRPALHPGRRVRVSNDAAVGGARAFGRRMVGVGDGVRPPTGWIRIWRVLVVGWWVCGMVRGPAVDAAERGESAVVVYNKALPESRSLAEYYAQARGVPSRQVIGLDLPSGEVMSRVEYRVKLEMPLLKRMEDLQLWKMPPSRTVKAGTNWLTWVRPVESSVRYLVLCHGVPLKIQHDPTVVEENSEKVRSEFRRNEAAVDSELALLPFGRAGERPLYGPVVNRVYGVTNAAVITPTNGVLMVGRLDGPSAALARGLVDRALQAERDGLWGRAYFDTRGITNGNYRLGDEWIGRAAELARQIGIETVRDSNPETFSAGFPMSHVALYAGWYDANASGPFGRPRVDFMPGAVAYHLHSFSAATIRSTTAHWVGPLVDRGVTATMGCVAEPYLEATPDLSVFFSRLILFGFTFGEAAWAAQPAVSWQTTVVGDPLYQPFGRAPAAMHADLAGRDSPLLEWSILRAINQNMVMGEPASKYIEFLGQIRELTRSAVLLEKLGDLERDAVLLDAAAGHYRQALERSRSEPQRVRLHLSLAAALEVLGRDREAVQAYEELVRAMPDHPDVAVFRARLAALIERSRPGDRSLEPNPQ